MTQAKTFEVSKDTEGRADKILATAFPDTSRSLIKRAIEDGKVYREDGSLIHRRC